MVWEIEEYMPCEEFDDWLAWMALKEEWRQEALRKAKAEASVKSKSGHGR